MFACGGKTSLPVSVVVASAPFDAAAVSPFSRSSA